VRRGFDQFGERGKKDSCHNDKDFGELVFLQKRIPAGVILFRVKGQRVDDKIIVLRELMQKYRHRLLTHFVVLTERKIRIIPLEELQ